MENHLRARSEGDSRLASLLGPLLLAGVILVAVILFSPLNTPVIPRDEGVFVYIGRGILHGQVPYRDLWDHKGPLIYFINALGLWLGGGSLWGIWAVESILLAASLTLLYGLLRRVLTGEAAVFGLITWLAGFIIVLGGNIVEEYAILPAVLSVLLAVGTARLSGLWLGALAGLSFMLRPNEIAAPAVALAFVLIRQFGVARWKGVATPLIQSAIGFVAVAAGFIAYFSWSHALDEFINCDFVFNFQYVEAGGNGLSSLLAGAGYLAVPVLFSAVCLGMSVFARSRPSSADQRRLLQLAAALLLVSVPLSLLSGRTYRHYYVSWLLPLSLLSAYAIHFARELQRKTGRCAGLWLISWTVLALAAVIGVRIRAVPLLAGGMPAAEAQAVQGIRDTVPQADEMFFWGNETSYAIMADRKLSGRYIFLAPLFVPGYGQAVAGQLLAELSSSRPIIIDTSASDPSIPSLAEDAPQPYLGPIYAFIHDHYRIAGRVPGKNWVVWEPE